MQIKIYRYDPSQDSASRCDAFEVPVKPHWTVMDVLDYISESLDGTLAYFKHAACDHGICGRCSLRVNGKVKLACSAEISDETALMLEPANGGVIRDLVVKQ